MSRERSGLPAEFRALYVQQTTAITGYRFLRRHKIHWDFTHRLGTDPKFQDSALHHYGKRPTQGRPGARRYFLIPYKLHWLRSHPIPWRMFLAMFITLPERPIIF